MFDVAQVVHDYLGAQVELSVQTVTGGDIHHSFCVEIIEGPQSGERLFIKTNSADRFAVMQSEYRALQVFQNFEGLHYPKPLHLHHDERAAYLIMPFHPMCSLDSAAAAEAGEALARQHQISQSEFGWGHDNHIGSNSQANSLTSSWTTFYRDCRLLPQLQLAKSKGLDQKLSCSIQTICDEMDVHLGQHEVTPALLHGDLWSGNLAFDQHARRPLFFDPAPYFGDPEADIAMTRLFGQFAPAFYTAYHRIHPKSAGFERRQSLYKLYHALNHYTLFGSMYQSLVQESTSKIQLLS